MKRRRRQGGGGTGGARDGPALAGTVRDVTAHGEAVIATERGIVLAGGALPGERVRVSVLGHSRGVARGRVLEIVEASADRVAAPCPVVERCGGCALMTLSATAQHTWKRTRLAHALAGLLPAELEVGWVDSPRAFGYRSRARLAWQRRGRECAIGYRMTRSRTLVDVAQCAVLEPELVSALGVLRDRLRGELQGEGEITLGSVAPGRAVALLQSADVQPAGVYRTAEALCGQPPLAGITLQIGAAAPACFGASVPRARGPEEQSLSTPLEGFSQANRELNAELVRAVVDAAEPVDASLLELYAGYGNFTLPLAERAAQVSAVEADAKLCAALRDNVAALGLGHVRVRCEDAAVAAAGARVDVVVLDPPRTGARAAVPGVLARRPRRIVYVSCDPATLARDLGAMTKDGYSIDRAVAFDMFPQTPHVEALVRLIKR